MTKNEKAKELVDKNKVLFDGKNRFYELWTVIGKHDNYQVSYSIPKETYNCTCKNIRVTSCYHIVAVQMKKGEKQ